MHFSSFYVRFLFTATKGGWLQGDSWILSALISQGSFPFG